MVKASPMRASQSFVGRPIQTKPQAARAKPFRTAKDGLSHAPERAATLTASAVAQAAHVPVNVSLGSTTKSTG